MKLAVFSGQYFWFDGKHYSTDEAFVKFITSFYPYFEKIVFCDAVIKESKTQAYILDPAKTEVCPLPDFSVYSFWKNMLLTFPKIYRIVKDNIYHWDVIWLHAPHPVSLICAHICRKLHKPFFLFIRQNLKVYVGCRNQGARKILAVSVACALEYIFRLLSRYTPTFAVGTEIFDMYRKGSKRIYQTAVSLVSDNDIAHTVGKEMPINPSEVRLLSVGRLDPEKGITYLIQAMGQMVTDGRTDIILEIVGKGAEEKRLRWQVSKLGLDQYVNFRGYVGYGPQLLSLYRKCDIYILPSLTEGWPQTLFEAMASGVPVVATRVGGIPYLIEDEENGLLINPGSPSEISQAIKLLISDSTLRHRIIRNGLSTVKMHTMEAERDRIMYRIQELLTDTGFRA